MGWYRWPGWYLAGMLTILPIVVAVDAALGPLMTFIIANPSKPRTELGRDISVIAGVQILALVYGAFTLWSGRPLYYVYSGLQLSMVQASDIGPAEINLARQANPDLAPYWYSRPRWVYVPNSGNGKSTLEQAAATRGISELTPSDMRPWSQGTADLRKSLKKMSAWEYFSVPQKAALKQRMAAQGYAVDAANTIPVIGKGPPLLAIVDTNTMTIQALLRCD